MTKPAFDRYVPLDELMARPRMRILRALRFFDWISQEDVVTACNAPDDETGRNTFWCAMGQAVKRGEVERGFYIDRGARMGQPVKRPQFRITNKGREALQRLAQDYEVRLMGEAA